MYQKQHEEEFSEKICLYCPKYYGEENQTFSTF